MSVPGIYGSAQRRKTPVTYGKAKRITSYSARSLGTFLDEKDTDTHGATTAPRLTPSRAKSAAKPTPARSLAYEEAATPKSEYDVISSEDDDQTAPQTTVSRPRPAQRPASEFDVPSSDEEAQTPRPVSRPSLQRRKASGRTPYVPRAEKDRKVEGTDRLSDRKRKRTQTPMGQRSEEAGDGITGIHLCSRPKAEDAAVTSSQSQRTNVDTTAPGEAAVSKSIKTNAPESVTPRRSKRAPPNARSPRPVTPGRGLSAPGRLSDMIVDVQELPTVSVSALTLPDTTNTATLDDTVVAMEDVLPSTPETSRKYRTTSISRTVSTPKESQLWKDLLPPSDPPSRSPDTTKIAPLRNAESGRTRRKLNMVTPALVRSASDMPVSSTAPRSRLVDRLKQTTLHFDDDEEGEDDEDEARLDEDDPMVLDGTAHSGQASANESTQPSRAASQTQISRNSQQSSIEQSTGPRTTYARMRSYLQEDNFENDLLLAMPLETPMRPMGSARRGNTSSKPGNDSVFDMGDDSDEQSQGIQSIHELRARASKKRFMDDLDVLLEDIKNHKASAKSRRRSALIELATKLVEKEYAARFLEHGYDIYLAREFAAGSQEPIADIVLTMLLALVLDADAPQLCASRFQEAGAVEFVSKGLEDRRTFAQVAKDRNSNMSKMAQATFVEFGEAIRDSRLWVSDKPNTMTLRMLALRSMELLILKIRHLTKHGLQVPGMMEALAKTAAEAASAEETSSSNTITTETCLSILEAMQYINKQDAVMRPLTSHALTTIVGVLRQLLHNDSSTVRIQTLALRFSLNATLESQKNTNVFDSEVLISCLVDRMLVGFGILKDGEKEQDRDAELDILLLTLGLLSGLAEQSIGVCETFARSTNGLIVKAVQIFTKGREKAEQADSMEESQGNVAFGYLAVLLGNLCLSPKAKAQIKSHLPKHDLQILVSAVEEFVEYHKRVDTQAFEDQEGKGVWENFTDRLMAVVKRINGNSWDPVQDALSDYDEESMSGAL
ncbi:hypothetical protein M8818_005014 [Zalaria obscura]|uniref:Uncharacterized protein n=1 Tax=Zalaria obscura TaxID=2024903 RepID=A0ACC3SEK2_9PEZI